MKTAFFFATALLSCSLWAQQDSIYVSRPDSLPLIANDSLMIVTNTEASFPNGMRAFRRYMANNFNFHNVDISQLALDNNLSYYTIYLLFDIDKEGAPINFKPVNSTAKNSVYQEAVRVVKSSRWTPATKNGVAVKQTLSLPVSIYIEDLLEK